MIILSVCHHLPCKYPLPYMLYRGDDCAILLCCCFLMFSTFTHKQLRHRTSGVGLIKAWWSLFVTKCRFFTHIKQQEADFGVVLFCLSAAVLLLACFYFVQILHDCLIVATSICFLFVVLVYCSCFD